MGLEDTFNTALWGNTLVLTSLIASMTVNALVTGLIVFRIFKVFRGVKDITTSDEKSLGVTRGRKLRSVIFVITESGMALLVIQVARVVLVIIDLVDILWITKHIVSIQSIQWLQSQLGKIDTWWLAVYDLIVPIHEMLNVISSSLMAILCFTDNMDLARV